MAFKLTAVKEPVYDVELPPAQEGGSPITKSFPLWDFNKICQDAKKNDEVYPHNLAEVLRKTLDYPSLTPQQAYALEVDCARVITELEESKKLSRLVQGK